MDRREFFQTAAALAGVPVASEAVEAALAAPPPPPPPQGIVLGFGKEAKALAQGVGLTLTRCQKLYDIDRVTGKRTDFWTAGRLEVQVRCDRVVWPEALSRAVLAEYGDVTRAGSNAPVTIQIGDLGKVTVRYAVLNEVGPSVTAQGINLHDGTWASDPKLWSPGLSFIGILDVDQSDPAVIQALFPGFQDVPAGVISLTNPRPATLAFIR